ncbi:cytochrome c [Roseibium sp. RKSG952]|uniref:c-type cytochrome n=1 Tax=Roseibium sp. RKSG952 TaxID=2529384 RepID=UPI0012BD15E8|nr:cytochrome c [Roseibium sp. RKSG952]MTI00160.1 cytochrome c [Roseibium sp. RKSG952]
MKFGPGKLLTAGLGLVVVLAAGWAAFGTGGVLNPGKPERQRLLMPEDPELVAHGQKIYAANCASCHGNRLEGEPDWQTPNADGTFPAPPHDITGHTWHHGSELLFAITKYGVAQGAGLEGHVSNMPAFGGMLSDQDIIAVLSFIKSRWPEEIRLQHDALDESLSPGR